jgi:SNF2 family DNA or RNA helicase
MNWAMQNPQMDLQAQDRAHRIGQTKPVLIFRLISRHTIESKIMQRASEKRQLEALVIAKGVCVANCAHLSTGTSIFFTSCLSESLLPLSPSRGSCWC